MNDIVSISLLLIGHFIADFLCQSRDVAINKHHDIKRLSSHVFIYTCVLFFVILFIKIQSSYMTPILFFTVLNGTIHFYTDLVTSKFNAWAWTTKREKLFWNGIGFDQLLHSLTLVLSYGYIFT